MKRRDFAAGLGSFGMLPLYAQAQSPAKAIPKIGILMAVAEADQEGMQRVDALTRALAEAGLHDGRDISILPSWYAGSFERAKAGAAALLQQGADIFVVNGTPGMDAVAAVGIKAPVVFVVVSNPVGAGYVSDLSRPGGNTTGFSTFEPVFSGKWLQFLAQVTPNLKHVSMLLDPKFIGFNSLWKALEEIASRGGMTAVRAEAGSLDEIERALEDLKRRESAGLIVSPSPVNTVNRKRLIEMTIERRIPAIFPFRFYVRDGALLAYGFNAADQFRRAGDYVARILRGTSPGDLPVQGPSVFELGVNLKTAKAIGVTVPQSLLISADEIIE